MGLGLARTVVEERAIDAKASRIRLRVKVRVIKL